MTLRNPSWDISLIDSVYALGAAARECQRAYQAAVLACGHVDLDRIKLLDGKVDRRYPGRTIDQEPHLAALSRIGTIQLETKHRLERLYTDAAMAYAHGANWAVRQVQVGEQPARVLFEVDVDGGCDFGGMPALQLDRYSRRGGPRGRPPRVRAVPRHAAPRPRASGVSSTWRITRRARCTPPWTLRPGCLTPLTPTASRPSRRSPSR